MPLQCLWTLSGAPSACSSRRGSTLTDGRMRPCAAISDGYLVNPIADTVVHEANRLRFPMAVPDAPDSPAALVMILMCWPIGGLTVFFALVALFGAWRGRARA
jgi:hypothetical protein